MAKFSKAHYVALAKVIKNSAEYMNYSGTPGIHYGVLRQNLMNMLAADNPKFDQMRFIKASNPEVKR